MADRRFPPPVVVAELEACFIDQSGIGTCSLFGATGAGAVGVGRGRGSGGGATCGIRQWWNRPLLPRVRKDRRSDQ